MFIYNKKYQIDWDNPFIGTERFSPVINLNDLPHKADPFHIPIEEWDDSLLKNCTVDVKWWNEQRRRCWYGYTVPNARKDNTDISITGRHYFYLNFWWIYGLDNLSKVKKLIHPRFTDLDYETFWKWQTAFLMMKDDLNYKARQKGFTEKIAGGILGYNMVFFPDSVNVIVSGSQDDSDQAFNNVKRGLDKLINTQFYKNKSKGGNRKDFLMTYPFGSKLYSLTSKNNPQVVSRLSPTVVVYEELGKWEKGMPLAVRGFVQPSIENEGQKTGWQFYIGTSGGEDNGGTYDLEKLYHNPVKYNLLSFEDNNEEEDLCDKNRLVGGFINRNKYCIVDRYGNSLRQESIDYHKSEEKRCKTESDLFLYRINNPRYASDGFQSPSGGFFNKKVIATASNHLHNIKLNKKLQITRKGHFVWNNKDKWEEGAHFVDGENENNEYTCEIIETPNEIDDSEKYYASIDSYDRDEANTSSSRGSMTIFKKLDFNNSFSDTWICRLFYRPSMNHGGAERFYEETAKIAIAYKCYNRTLIEYSNLRIFDFYTRKNLDGLLQERPDFVLSNIINNTSVNNKYGIDPSTKPFWLSDLNDYLYGEDGSCKNVTKIFDQEMLLRIIKFKYNPSKNKYNDDVIITMALNIIQRKQIIEEILHKNQVNDEKFTNFGISSIYSGFNPKNLF